MPIVECQECGCENIVPSDAEEWECEMCDSFLDFDDDGQFWEEEEEEEEEEI